MAAYRTKIIDYDYKERVAVYRRSIEYGNKTEICSDTETGHRQKYAEMSETKQKESDNRRVRYYRKIEHDLIEIALMNPDLCTAVTLTFRDSVTSYNYAVGAWESFLKRLRHSVDMPLKYICVWEYQKARSKKEGIENGGVFHFHAIMNIGYFEHSVLEKVWGNGYVWIDQLEYDKKREKAVKYAMKYIVKELTKRIEAGEDERGERFYFTSNNLRKPQEKVVKEQLNLDDLIVEHMENMIKDGSYEIKNARGKAINCVEYIEYRK